MNKFFLITIFLIIMLVGGVVLFVSRSQPNTAKVADNSEQTNLDNGTEELVLVSKEHPLTIESLRKGEYFGSEFVIEEDLGVGSNYRKYRVSYLSEGFKIYGLLTVPNEKRAEGWPVIVFNHGYIPPAEYRTTERYVAYQDAFAKAGYVTIKSDYRGHGNSEGVAAGGYGSNAYTIDVINALESVKKYPGVNVNKIGMWGHSMGGYITLRTMVVRGDIKAGVIWAGVVASYPDLLNNWRRRSPQATPVGSAFGARRWRDMLVEQYGTPEMNPEFWSSISANAYLNNVSGPIQLHHGTADTSVPVEFSQKLKRELDDMNKVVEYHEYSGDDHNLTDNLSLALKRSIEFFDKYLK